MGNFTGISDGRVAITGDRVFLSPNVALSLSMALHELATNALKYGAWSVPEGRVRIAWREDAQGQIVLDWEESGGPEVRAPERSGFGTRLLERGIARELGGNVTVDFDKKGLRCRIEFDRRGNGDATQPDASGGRG